jgi:lambda family phage portal protein
MATVDVQYAGFNNIRKPTFRAASTDYKQAHREALVSDIDLASARELLFLQSRSKYMCINNPIASGALKKYKKNLGAIDVQWVNKKGKVHKKMTKLWDEFKDSPCLDGKGNLDTFQTTLNSDRFMSGEGIARMIIRRKNNPNRIPLKLQGIESEYLDATYTGADRFHPQGLTRYGITFDKDTYNIPEIYNFFQERYFGLSDNFTNPSVRVEVSARDVLHCFERLRSNQWRGIPVLSSAMIPLYNLEDLCTATVATQTAASAVSWIIEQNSSYGKIPLGVAQTRGDSAANDPKNKLVFDATGGSVQYTNSGDVVKLIQSRDIGNNLIGLIKEQYQEIAASIDSDYFDLTGDMQGMNFSSIRAALVKARRRLEFEYDIVLIPDVLAPLCKRFKELAVIGNAVDDAYPTYIFPKWYGVDDLKDAQANLLKLLSGQKTMQDVWKEEGYSEEQITESLAIMKELGINQPDQPSKVGTQSKSKTQVVEPNSNSSSN